MDGGVDGLGLGGGGLIERRIPGDGESYVGDGDEDADGPVGGLLGVLGLVEIAGGVVVDGGPEELGEIFAGGVGCGEGGADLVADAGELVCCFGVGAGGVGEMKAVADHLGAGGGDEVEGRVRGGLHAA